MIESALSQPLLYPHPYRMIWTEIGAIAPVPSDSPSAQPAPATEKTSRSTNPDRSSAAQDSTAKSSPPPSDSPRKATKQAPPKSVHPYDMKAIEQFGDDLYGD